MATRSCKRTTEICSMYLFKVITRSVGRNGFVIPFWYMLLLETSFSKWTTDFIISFFYTKTIAHPLYFPWLGTTAQRKESAHHVDCGQWLNADFAVSVSHFFMYKMFPSNPLFFTTQLQEQRENEHWPVLNVLRSLKHLGILHQISFKLALYKFLW